MRLALFVSILSASLMGLWAARWSGVSFAGWPMPVQMLAAMPCLGTITVMMGLFSAVLLLRTTGRPAPKGRQE